MLFSVMTTFVLFCASVVAILPVLFLPQFILLHHTDVHAWIVLKIVYAIARTQQTHKAPPTHTYGTTGFNVSGF